MEQGIRHPNSHYVTDNLKTIIDSLKSIFTTSIKGPVQPIAANLLTGAATKFGNYILYSHQRALIEEMKRKETAFRTGTNVAGSHPSAAGGQTLLTAEQRGGSGIQLFSRFAILGDPIGTGKTIASLAYIAKCKRVPIPPISPYLHPQSHTNFFSTSSAKTTIKTNLFIIPNMDLPQLIDTLENQNELSYKIIKKTNHINQTLIEELSQLDLIVIPVSQYSTFCEFMNENSITFERSFFENIDNIHLTNNNSSIISHFTWLITNNWFNYIFPETNLFDYGSTLDNFMANNYNNLPSDLQYYIQSQRTNTQHSTPNNRSLFNNFVIQHPYRHQLITITTGSYLSASLCPGKLDHKIIKYNIDERFQVIYPIYSQSINTLINQNDIMGALDAIGSQILPREQVLQLCRNQSEEQCPICFVDYNVPTLTPCCKNLMCAECIIKSCVMNLTNKCPFCRQEIHGTKLIASDISTNSEDIEEQGISKINALVNYLKEKTNESILLYFPNQARFSKLKKALKLNNIHYEILSGPRSANKAKIGKFNLGRTNLLIVHDQDHLIGYYIPKVSHLIIYPDFCNLNIRQFLMGRIQSFVRVAPLTVVDFTFEGTAVAVAGDTGTI